MCGNFAGERASGVGARAQVDGARPVARPATGSPLIVEEKPICRVAIANVLTEAAGTPPAAFAGTLAEATQVVQAGRTSLLLVDLFSIGFDFDGLRRLLTVSGAPAIAIDDRPNPSFAAMAQMAGARGYVSKNCEVGAFRNVIRTVVAGGAHFPREMAAAPRRNRTGAASTGLSPRQLDVLKCIAVGMSNQEIARALGITPGTVKLHIHAILRLTGARNRTEAALISGRFLAQALDN